MSQCRHCGAYVSPRDKVCSYCGAPNPDYQPPETDVNRLLQQGLDAFRAVAYNLGVMYKSMGRNREARKHLESALQLAETDPALDDRKRMKQTIKQKLETLP